MLPANMVYLFFILYFHILHFIQFITKSMNEQYCLHNAIITSSKYFIVLEPESDLVKSKDVIRVINLYK